MPKNGLYKDSKYTIPLYPESLADNIYMAEDKKITVKTKIEQLEKYDQLCDADIKKLKNDVSHQADALDSIEIAFDKFEKIIQNINTTENHVHTNKNVLDKLGMSNGNLTFNNNLITDKNSHTHTNKVILDSISQDKIDEWDNKSNFSGSYNDLSDLPPTPMEGHEHENKSVLDTITPAKIAEWNNKSNFSGKFEDLSGKPQVHTHNNKSALDLITKTKIDTWNNKSEFSGNYNDLTNKPSIPSIEGLATEIYVKNAINNAISNIGNGSPFKAIYPTNTGYLNMTTDAFQYYNSTVSRDLTINLPTVDRQSYMQLRLYLHMQTYAYKISIRFDTDMDRDRLLPTYGNSVYEYIFTHAGPYGWLCTYNIYECK